MKKNILVVGGTSGLGLILAKKHAEMGHTVHVTGRQDPNVEGILFHKLDVSSDIGCAYMDVEDVLDGIEEVVHTLIYCAGFYQQGTIDQLSPDGIVQMYNLSGSVPALFVNFLKQTAGNHPLKLIFITSSSSYTPREKEPCYASAKAALAMLGESLSLDYGLGKVLVVAPSGMKTDFFKGQQDTSQFLDPEWVASQIIEFSGGVYKFRLVHITRDPKTATLIRETPYMPDK